jgi:hypothetical protein
VSIEQKIDFVQELDESIREKSIQYFSDSKLCRLNSGHPYNPILRILKPTSNWTQNNAIIFLLKTRQLVCTWSLFVTSSMGEMTRLGELSTTSTLLFRLFEDEEEEELATTETVVDNLGAENDKQMR